MDRTKTYTRVAGRCLISFALLFPLLSQGAASPFKVGKVTQVQGTPTFLNFVGPHKVVKVKSKKNLLTEGSYLTSDSAYFTAQLFEGSWLRVSPETKFSIDFAADTKFLTITLLTGSLKILFSNELNQKKIEKIIVKTADTVFETVGAKFVIIRNPMMNLNNLYVEKGAVIAAQFLRGEKKDTEMVHIKEMVSIKDDDMDIHSPKPMTDKEVAFLDSNHYLKQVKDKAIKAD